MISKLIIMAICSSLIRADARDEFRQEFMEVTRNCTESLDIDEAELDEFMLRRPLQMGKGNMRCFFQCLFRGMGYIDENGYPSPMLKLRKFPPECFPDKEDICERAFYMLKCIIDIEEEN